jgi:sensor c-di-GMP phosphodiesterase-like protein
MLQPTESPDLNQSLSDHQRAKRSHISDPTLVDIMAGMNHREFFFHFQPILELETGKQIGSEMLIRWIRNGEVLLPSRFFPSLEEHSLLKKIDQYVINQVLELNWDQIIHPDFAFRLFINVSTESISDPFFLDPMAEAAERILGLGMIPVVELSERTRFDPDIITEGISGLRSRGVEVALDDFGAGYSSLARLVNLPLDILKIDRHLTASIGSSTRGEAILDSVLALAGNIGLKIVVEGVETELQADWLRMRKPCWVQGYLFGYPVPMNYSGSIEEGGGGEEPEVSG